MILTKDQLKAIMPQASNAKLDLFLPLLNRWMPHYGIVTARRACHFLSQIAHESAQLTYVEEIASGAAYDTGRLAARLGNTPEKDGDGQKYKGRGLIQITGHDNYEQLGKDWNVDLLSNPQILTEPTLAVRSACWFWWKNGLNRIADKGSVLDVTRIVNGGTNGLNERLLFYDRAKRVIV